MNVTITPGTLTGQISAPPSKSHAHRLLIAAALAGTPMELAGDPLSEDLAATQDVLAALCEKTRPAETPVSLDCRESGSTLRFLLPVAAVLVSSQPLRFLRRGRLPLRALSSLKEEMIRHGVSWREEGSDLVVQGPMQGGDFLLDGGISSQFISGLLFALPLTKEGGMITVVGELASRPYVDMTLAVLQSSGIQVTEEPAMAEESIHGMAEEKSPVTTRFLVAGRQQYQLPHGSAAGGGAVLAPEGDWSNGAVWLVANALGSHLSLTGLDPHSCQGDRIITDIIAACALQEHSATLKRDTARRVALAQGVLSTFDRLPDELVVDVTDTPDLVPILGVQAWGTGKRLHIIGGARLRDKESDRLATTKALLDALSCPVEIMEDGLWIAPQEPALLEAAAGSNTGTPIIVEGANDHRIVMAAAIAATIAPGPVTIRGAEAVRKSYPDFFDLFAKCGGQITIEE